MSFEDELSVIRTYVLADQTYAYTQEDALDAIQALEELFREHDTGMCNAVEVIESVRVPKSSILGRLVKDASYGDSGFVLERAIVVDENDTMWIKKNAIFYYKDPVGKESCIPVFSCGNSIKIRRSALWGFGWIPGHLGNNKEFNYLPVRLTED